jgi:2-dehydro-3-deoxygluconokinase
MIGNEQDLGGSEHPPPAGAEEAAAMVERMAAANPGFSVIATTLRTVHSATVNDWGALAWSPGTGVVAATHRERLEVLDRVGGGDSFASGLIAGLLEGEDLATAVEYGAAHGALAMTTPGDASMASRAEVLALVGGATARVAR